MTELAKVQELRTVDEPPTLVDQTMSKSIGNLAFALSKAQGEITGARKDSTNPFFKSNYADLSSVLEASREPLAKNDLAVIQTTESTDSGIVVITTLAHKSGEWVRGKIRMVPVKNDPQGIGSCITYARRYAYSAIVGIAQVDDDGNAASQQKAPVKRISDEQALTLNAMITDHDLDMPKILAWLKSAYKCNSIEELTTDVYPTVVRAVEKKIQK